MLKTGEEMSKVRVKSIETIRFFAILIIITTHYWSFFMPEMMELIYIRYNKIFIGISGKLGVCMFCVLLGYFVADNCSNEEFDLIEYIVKRYLKFIIPTCIINSSVFLGIKWYRILGKKVLFLDKDINIKVLLNDIFFLGNVIVPTYWCIKWFFIASVIIAFCIVFAKRKFFDSFFCLLIAAVICFLSGKIWYLNCTFGGVIYFLNKRIRIEKNIIYGLLILLIVLLYRNSESELTYIKQGIACALFLFIVLQGKILWCLLNSSYMAKLGGLSMGVFYLHIPFYCFFTPYIIQFLRFFSIGKVEWYAFIVSIVIIYSLSYIFSKKVNRIYQKVMNIDFREKGCRLALKNYYKKISAFSLFAGGLLIYSVLTFLLFYNQAIGFKNGYPSDIRVYIDIAYGKKAGGPAPYPLYFFLIRFVGYLTSSELAAALVTMGLNMVTPCAMYYYWNKKSIEWKKSEEERKRGVIILFSLLFVSMIICRTFNKNLYLGQGTPNPWHNQTILATRGFAIIAFFQFLKLYQSNKGYIGIRDYFVFALMMFTTTFTKPSFSFCFIPSCGLLMLYRLWKEKFHCLKEMFLLGICFVPTFLLLLYQYLITFTDYGEQEGIGIKIGYVWSRYSPNILISILLAALFPITIFIINWKKIKDYEFYQISIVTFFVGMLEFLIFYEKGPRMGHANFAWGYYHGLFFLFLSAMFLFYQTFRKGKIWYRFIGIFTYSLHLLSGLYYFFLIFLGKTYL